MGEGLRLGPIDNVQGMRDRYLFILHIPVATTQIARVGSERAFRET